MRWSDYWAFLAFAALLVVIPGPDFAVVTKNTLMGGPRRGRWTALGIGVSNAVQGTAAVAGLSALIVRAQPVFEAIKWGGVGYLIYLGAQSLRSAIRGHYQPMGGEPEGKDRGPALGGWRQGFLSNMTNPKVLVFYLAVLPQFLHRGAAPELLLAFAGSHAVLSVIYLFIVTAALGRLRAVLARRKVRRAMDAVTGSVLIGFGANLATEHA